LGSRTELVARSLIGWHARFGRHDLPWQLSRTPYRVWVSEIMLQQTQVATVIPYFERFMRRFADETALAAASLDEVLHLWAGLGYYARARNLHRAAECIRERFGGRLPTRFAELASLPGIGRSTAGAILALSRGERHPILDGNVRRVLARYFGIEGDPSSSPVREMLWRRADECTPHSDVATYTQAIMDLGATVCTRRRARCADCPLAEDCYARHAGRQETIPAPRARARRGSRHAFLLVARRSDGSVLLTRRPRQGVWGGLWCLPEFGEHDEARAFASRALGEMDSVPRALESSRHAFTHFDLTITPLYVDCPRGAEMTCEPSADFLWYHPREPVPLGLPAPVHVLIDRLTRESEI
jgi:A/G-specific adenine glycosylase